MKRGFFYYLGLTLLFTAYYISLYAEESVEITVKASRLNEDLMDIPSSVYVIDSDDIIAINPTTVEDLFRNIPSISIKSYGALGSKKSLSIRGSSSSDVLILLDGIPLNTAWDGEASINFLPISSIDRIEILPGTMGGQYGPNAVGGVINIITKKADKKSFSINLKNLSYLPDEYYIKRSTETVKARADYTSLVDAQNLMIETSIPFYSDGTGCGFWLDITRANNGWIWYDESLNGMRGQENNAFLGYKAGGNIGLVLDNAFINVQAIGAKNNKELPGSLSWPTPESYQNDTDFSISSSLTMEKSYVDFLNLSVKTGYSFKNIEYAYDSSSSIDVHKIHSYFIDLQQGTTSFNTAKFLYGAFLKYDVVDSTKIKKNRSSGGFFFSSTYKATERFNINGNIRIDNSNDFPLSFAGDVGTLFYISGNSTLGLKTGTSYRIPSLIDLYWPGYSNSDLLPERSWDGELVYKYMKDNDYSISFSAFTRYTKDDIILDSSWIPQNLGASLISGVEISSDFSFLDNLYVEINYSFLKSFVLKDSNSNYSINNAPELIYTPEHKYGVKFSYNNGAFSLFSSLLGQSAVYTDKENTSFLDGWTVVNIGSGYKFDSGLIFDFIINNIFNTVYQTIEDYPTEPISIELSCGYSF
ncbi:TonB-dependent receptor [Spirochaetia bacterium 38H-sp]|uniref:TonB-dependent receptor n=1 Tax=Rarispira pelagica TaxID=3141764 RepID=A0ABU9U8U7_9SPIR